MPIDYIELDLWRVFGCDPRTIEPDRLRRMMTCLYAERAFVANK